MMHLRPFLLLVLSLRLAAAQNAQDSFQDTGIATVFPGSAYYDAASQAYNTRFEFNPAVVTFPSSAEEVAQVVRIAADNNLDVVARSGGHSYIANSLGGKDGSLVVDLRNLTDITLDPATNVASIQTGVRLGDIALALNAAEGGPRGLPHGTCPTVGIGGHAGHGGYGFVSRLWGLTLDVIVGMDVVLPNGTLVSASSDENSELFWGMRGAASSLGIATTLRMQTFEAPSYAIVYSYRWHVDYQPAAQILAAYQTWAQADNPAETGNEINISGADDPGYLTLQLLGGWYGPEEDFNTTMQSFFDTVPPYNSSSLLGNGTYIDSVVQLTGRSLTTDVSALPNDTFYAKSLMTPTAEPLTDDAWRNFTAYLVNEGNVSDTRWYVQVELYGGNDSRINEVPLDSTAFARRDALFTIQFYATFAGTEPPYPDGAFTFLNNVVNNITSGMPSDWDYGAYLNYADNNVDNYEYMYYGSHYSRLQELKRNVDPNNMFNVPTAVQV